MSSSLLHCLTKRLVTVAFILIAPALWPQSATESVAVKVHFNEANGVIPPVWNFFGYDEPNYTYAANGKKLLGELARLSPVPPFVRVHNLLTSGDGSASLKWGSTNVYTEDVSGKAVYDWAILDRIFDAFYSAGIRPLVEIAFMPKALSTSGLIDRKSTRLNSSHT